MIKKDTYKLMKKLISEYEMDYDEYKSNEPFLAEHVVVVSSETRYNPKYGDTRRCECGFTYLEHFRSKRYTGCRLTNNLYGRWRERLDDVRDRKIDKLLN